MHRSLYPCDSLGQQSDFVLAVDVDLEVEVTGGHLVGDFDNCIDRAGDAARDDPGESQGQQYGKGSKNHDHASGRIAQLVGRLAGLLHLDCLKVDQRIDPCNVFGLAFAQITLHQNYDICLFVSLEQLQELVLGCYIQGTGVEYLLEQGFALFAAD